MFMRVGVVAAAVLLSGCFARVRIPAPLTSDPDEWERVQVASVRTSALVLQRGPRIPERLAAVDLDAVILRNEIAVEDPRDLVPLVAPDSDTARLAMEWGKRYDRWRGLQTASASSLGAAVTLFLVPIIGNSLFRDSGFSSDLSAPFLFTALGLAGASAVCVLVGAIFVGKIDQLRLDAFRAYSADLEARRLAFEAR